MNIKKMIAIAMTLFFVLINPSGNFFETIVFASENSSEVQEYKVDDIITVTHKTDVDTLYEDDQAELNLIIENISNQSITITDIYPTYAEEYLTADLIRKKTIAGEKIRPGQSILVTYKLTTKKEVRPGKNDSIFLNIGFEKNKIPFNKIQTIDLNIQITAMDAIFSNFKISSVLLIPGFIITFIFISILRIRQINWATILEITNPLVVISGIVISIILNILIHTIFPGISSNNRIYGTNYILWVYFFSVIVALLVAYGYLAIIKKINQARTFTTDDDAMAVLIKVSRNQTHLNLNLGKFDDMVQNIEEKLLLLPKNSTKESIKISDDKDFFCQKILIRPRPKTKKDLYEELKKISIEEKDSKKLVQFLKGHQDEFELSWSDGTNGTISKVIAKPSDPKYISSASENLVD